MASTKELETKVEQLESILRQYGLLETPKTDVRPEERADYIEFGSPEHAQLLGLVIADGDADTDERLTYKSQKTGTVYMLEDEVTPYMTFPDPKQVAALVLRQKVSAFESGRPRPPDNAPSLWKPIDLGTGQ